MPRSLRSFVPVVLALLSGCQAASPTLGPSSFALGRFVEVSPAPLGQQAANAMPPAPPPPAPKEPTVEPNRRSSGGGSSGGGRQPAVTPASVTYGSLKVDLAEVAGALAPASGFRVLATAEEVDKLVVTVSIDGQADRVQTITAAELQAGTTSVTFSELPTGTCVITIEAFDASSASIGVSSRVAGIAQDAETQASVRTHLIPDAEGPYTYANTFVLGVELAAVAVPEGEGLASGTVASRFEIEAFNGLFADGAGHFYTGSLRYLVGQWVSGMRRFSVTDGSHLGDYVISLFNFFGGSAPRGMAYDAINGQLVVSGFGQMSSSPDPTIRVIKGGRECPIVVDAAGVAYFAENDVIYRSTAAETTPTTVPAHSAVVLGAAGAFWVNAAETVAGSPVIRSEVKKYAADGTLLGTFPLPIPAVRLKSDGEGGVWVGDRPGGQLVRVQADGTVGVALGVTAKDYCLDDDKNLWVAGGPRLLKLSPDGLQLGSFPIDAEAISYGDGFLFAAVSPETDDGGQDVEFYTNAVLKIVP